MYLKSYLTGFKSANYKIDEVIRCFNYSYEPDINNYFSLERFINDYLEKAAFVVSSRADLYTRDYPIEYTGYLTDNGDITLRRDKKLYKTIFDEEKEDIKLIISNLFSESLYLKENETYIKIDKEQFINHQVENLYMKGYYWRGLFGTK